MTYTNGINKKDTYTLIEVFGREKFFYDDTNVRIEGWETQASVFYVQDNRLKIRFKNVLKPYYDEYQDKEFDGAPDSVFFNVEKEDYSSKEAVRRMRYAIEQYKKSNECFSCVALNANDIADRLCGEDLFGDVYSFEGEIDYSEFYDASCCFFPVDVDAFITDFSDRFSFGRNEAMLVYWDGSIIRGRVGFDGCLYRDGNLFLQEDDVHVYDIKNGVREM